jgi:hypothetical protein
MPSGASVVLVLINLHEGGKGRQGVGLQCAQSRFDDRNVLLIITHRLRPPDQRSPVRLRSLKPAQRGNLAC